MEIYGTCIKYTHRNEKTGESTILVRAKEGDFFCHGIMQNYPALTPVKAVGTQTGQTFQVESIHMALLNKEDISKFLSGEYFMGIGDATANKLADTIIQTPEIIANYESSLSDRMKAEAVTNALRKIKNLIAFEELYEYISGFGGRYYIAQEAFLKYRDESLQHIKQYPYTLLMFDAPFGICEKIAKENKIEEYQKERIHAMVKDTLIRNHNNGNTKISFISLCDTIKKAEQNAGCGYHTNPLFIAEEVLKTDYHIEYTEDDTYIYLLPDYQAEVQIAGNIKRLMQSVAAYENPALSISELEKIFRIEYSDEQKECFSVINSSGIKIITGGPGTGKTTLLNGILTKFKANNPEKSIILCAPTGCAAKRMRETTGMEATTIHKLLQIKPYARKEAYQCREIDADCVIIDECSMIDTFLMALLLGAVKNGAMVIMIGDKDQLPSVDAGNVLRDFIESGIIEVHYLHTIFRQAVNNVIIENSKKVITGNAGLKENSQFKIKRFASGEELAKEAAELAKKCFECSIDSVKIYSPVRKAKFHCSTININRMIQREKNKVYSINEKSCSQVEYGFYRFYVGDGVIFTRNNYEKGYYNGQEGTISCIQKHTDTTHITIFTEDGNITISGSDINDIELNYAVTAHKSQGGECDNAIIIIPKKPKAMLQRKILYVEITRAKKNVIILSEQDALEQTISNYMEIPRTTGLKEKLKGLCA